MAKSLPSRLITVDFDARLGSLQFKGEYPLYGAQRILKLTAPSESFTLKSLLNGLSSWISESLNVSLSLEFLDYAWLRDLCETQIIPTILINKSASGSLEISLELRYASKVTLKEIMGVPLPKTFEIHKFLLKLGGSKKIDMQLLATVKAKNGRSSGLPKTLQLPLSVQPKPDIKSFQFNRLMIGQRIGPKVNAGLNTNGIGSVFDKINKDFSEPDPRKLLTDLAKNYYDPSLGWLVAADFRVSAFGIRLIFNDPRLYGIEVTIRPTDPKKPKGKFDGLSFSLLYTKEPSGHGTYSGQITFPDQMREIPLGSVVFTLPSLGASYRTNGDFRLEVGWPLSKGAIGLRWTILQGRAGFYIQSTRVSAPNTDKKVQYVAIGIHLEVSAKITINFSLVSLNVALTASSLLEGLLAWDLTPAPSIARLPDRVWFAGTFRIEAVLSGRIGLGILSTTISVKAHMTASTAIETGYGSELLLQARLHATADVKIGWWTISKSFSVDVSHALKLSSGQAIANARRPLERNMSLFHDSYSKAGLVHMPAIPLSAASAQEAPHAAPLPSQAAVSLEPLEVPKALRFASSQTGDRPVLQVQFFALSTALYEEDGRADFGVVALLGIPAPEALALSSEALPFDQLIAQLLTYSLNAAQNTQNPSSLKERLTGLNTLLTQSSPQSVAQTVKAFFAAQIDVQITAAPLDDTAVKGPMALHMLPMFSDFALHCGPQSVSLRTQCPIPSHFATVQEHYALPPDVQSSLQPTMREDQGGDPSLTDYLFGSFYKALLSQICTQLLESLQKDVPAQTPNELYASLLQAFDFAGTRGFAAHLLLSAQRYVKPQSLPDQVDWTQLADLETAPVYALNGQQFRIAATGHAQQIPLRLRLLEESPDWLHVTSSEIPVSLPAAVPAAPDVIWVETIDAENPDAIQLAYRQLKPISQTPYQAIPQPLNFENEGKIESLILLPHPFERDLLRTLARLESDQTTVEAQEEEEALLSLGLTTLDGQPVASHYGLLFEIELAPDALERANRESVTLQVLPLKADMKARLTSLLTTSPTTGAWRLQTRLLYRDQESASLQQWPHTAQSCLLNRNFTPSKPTADTVFLHPIDTLNETSVALLLEENALLHLRGAHLPQEMFTPPLAQKSITLYLFVTELKVTELAEDQEHAVEQPAERHKVRRGFNTLLPATPTEAPLAIGLFCADGAPLPHWESHLAAGDVAYEVTLRPARSTAEPVDVPALYQILQTNIAQQAGAAGLIWGAPLTSVRSEALDGAALALRHTLPAHLYYTPEPHEIFAGQTEALTRIDRRFAQNNRYDLIGQSLPLQFRLLDPFGNALPPTGRSSVEDLFHDRLISLTEWPFIRAEYDFERQDGQRVLALHLSLDEGALQQHIQSWDQQEAAQTPKDAARQLMQHFERIVEQLMHPQTSAWLSTSLSPHTKDIREDLLRFVIESASAVKAHIRQAASKAGSALIEPKLFYTLPLPEPLLSPSDDGPTFAFELFAEIKLQRDTPSDHIAAQVRGVGECVSRLTPKAPPQQLTPSAEPRAPFADFAARFDEIFTSYDGSSDLRLAFGKQADAEFFDPGLSLWAVKMGGKTGVDFGFQTEDAQAFAVPAPAFADPDLAVLLKRAIALLDTLSTPQAKAALGALSPSAQTDLLAAHHAAQEALRFVFALAPILAPADQRKHKEELREAIKDAALKMGFEALYGALAKASDLGPVFTIPFASDNETLSYIELLGQVESAGEPMDLSIVEDRIVSPQIEGIASSLCIRFAPAPPTDLAAQPLKLTYKLRGLSLNDGDRGWRELSFLGALPLYPLTPSEGLSLPRPRLDRPLAPTVLDTYRRSQKWSLILQVDLSPQNRLHFDFRQQSDQAPYLLEASAAVQFEEVLARWQKTAPQWSAFLLAEQDPERAVQETALAESCAELLSGLASSAEALQPPPSAEEGQPARPKLSGQYQLHLQHSEEGYRVILSIQSIRALKLPQIILHLENGEIVSWQPELSSDLRGKRERPLHIPSDLLPSRPTGKIEFHWPRRTPKTWHAWVLTNEALSEVQPTSPEFILSSSTLSPAP